MGSTIRTRRRRAAGVVIAAVSVVGLTAALAAQTPKPKSNTNAAPPGAFVVGDTQTVDPQPAPAAAPAPAVKHLPDPTPAQIQTIETAFTTKERLFRTLLQNYYTYTESVLVQELDGDGNPVGDYQQVNEIQYSPNGDRQIVCTYCPQPNLKDVVITEEDITDMFNMNMYTLSVDDLPQYNVTYVDHEPLDQVTVYVFSIAPKQIVKGHRYFQGKVFVDDRDLMIVKSDGRVVPNEYDKHGNPTNIFLPFQVWRQEIDGKYWFPVYTLMQGKIPPGQPGGTAVPMKMVIQFKDYKQFRSTARVVAVQTIPDGTTPPASPAAKKPAVPTIPHPENQN